MSNYEIASAWAWTLSKSCDDLVVTYKHGAISMGRKAIIEAGKKDLYQNLDVSWIQLFAIGDKNGHPDILAVTTDDSIDRTKIGQLAQFVIKEMTVTIIVVRNQGFCRVKDGASPSCGQKTVPVIAFNIKIKPVTQPDGSVKGEVTAAQVKNFN